MEGSPGLPRARVYQALSALLRVEIPGWDAAAPGPAHSARHSAPGVCAHRHLWGRGKTDRKHSRKLWVSKSPYSWTEGKQQSWKSRPRPDGGHGEQVGLPAQRPTPSPGFSAGRKVAQCLHNVSMRSEYLGAELSVSVEESHLNMSLVCYKCYPDALKSGLALQEEHLGAHVCKH